MNFLITGGGGFIGSNIVKELLKLNYNVKVLDNFSTGKRENLSEFYNDIEIIEGDVRSYHIVLQAVKNIDVILHQAALPSVPRSIIDPITTNDVNVNGTLNILNAAVSENVKRVVFASSSSVYGDNPTLPKSEDLIPAPKSPYAVSKLAAEYYLNVFSQVYDLETVALRYFNVFGPNQDPNSQYSAVIPKFIKAFINNEIPVIYGDGEQTRDFTYVSNVVNGNILASTQPVYKNLILNCACHDRISLNTLISKLNEIFKKNISPEYKSPRPGDVKDSFASIDKISEFLNFKPEVLFSEGIVKTVDYYSTK
ncbi:MAG: SDR family oxidoreductase [Ignavibacteria bacterium]|nr:SDR family oxidoreductase [Ignavibacteria bacterium]